MPKILLLMMCLMWSATTWAQTWITGKVVDTQNEPIIGASAVVKGSTTGSVTDIDRAYTLQAKAGDEITFSYIGFKTVNKVVKGNRIDVVKTGTTNMSQMLMGSAADKTVSVEAFLDALYMERGHELYYEGCRKVDMISFGCYYTDMKATDRTPSCEYFHIPDYAVKQAQQSCYKLTQNNTCDNYDGPKKNEYKFCIC